MINLKPSEDIVPMSEFRNNLSDCAARARKSGRPLLLTQNGRASYVFMDLAAFEEIREKLEKIEDIKGNKTNIEWGSQMRSYVFMPYTLVKDNRTGFESGNIQAVMDGEIDGFINAYLKLNAQSK